MNFKLHEISFTTQQSSQKKGKSVCCNKMLNFNKWASVTILLFFRGTFVLKAKFEAKSFEAALNRHGASRHGVREM